MIGHTLDTNSHWLAKQLYRLGWKLERITHLRDTLQSIESGTREALRRKPKVIITMGGLGPTHDDMTLAGIALALGKPLRLNDDALRLVKLHYEKLDSNPGLTRYRTKMATLPIGAKPLANPVGTAPGVKMERSGTTIFSLPGVPQEMKAIFRGSVTPYLKDFGASRPTEIQIRITGIIESALAPLLDKVRRAYPGLYFKSHPRGKETGVRPLIILQIYNVRQESEREVAMASRDVLRLLSGLGSRR